MSSFLQDQIRALGAAPVIVVMKKRDPAGAASVSKHFTKPPGKDAMLALAHGSLSAGPEKNFLVPAETIESGHYYPNLGIYLGSVDEAGLAALTQSSQVSVVHAAPVMSLIRPTAMRQARPRAAVSWGIKALKADRLWKQGLTGKGVLVGHLDTGIDGTHPALQGAIRHFGVAASMTGTISEPGTIWDTGAHGTHTAGTICARPVRSGNKTVHLGIAPGAELVGATVIEGGEVTQRIIAGLDWAVGKSVRIINMSLGLRGYVPNFEPIIQVLRDLDILPVVASGNEGPDTSRSPGNYETVLSVGAVNRNMAVADFSSSQAFGRPTNPIVPDLVGPGVDIESCAAGGGFAKMNGTSMAAPHIAGLAALLMEAVPNASAAHVEEAILASCSSLGDIMRSNRGFPDASRALNLLQGMVPT